MKTGDKVKIWDVKNNCSGSAVYTIVDVEGSSVKAELPDVVGYFIFSAESVFKVTEDEKG